MNCRGELTGKEFKLNKLDLGFQDSSISAMDGSWNPRSNLANLDETKISCVPLPGTRENFHKYLKVQIYTLIQSQSDFSVNYLRLLTFGSIMEFLI